MPLFHVVIKFIIQLLLGILLTLTVWPIFLLVTLINELIRLFVYFLLVLCSKRYSLVCGGDNFWNCDGGLPSKTVVLLLFSPDEVVSIEAERELWMTRILQDRKYVKLKKTLSTHWGYGCWEEDGGKFDIANHVRKYEFPNNWDTECTEKQLYEIIVPTLSKDIDPTKPRWEWLVIPRVVGSDGQISSVRVFRFHHAYMDGAHGGVLLAECLFDWMWEQNEPKKRPPFIVDPGVGAQQIFWAKMKALLMAPFAMIMFSLDSSSKNGFQDPFLTPKFSGKQYYLVSKKMENSILQRISRSSKRSLQSVFTTAFRSGFQKVLQQRVGLIGNQENVIVHVEVTQAIPSGRKEPTNEFSVSFSEIPLSPGSGWVDVDLGVKVLLTYFLIQWMGRLPIFLLDKIPKTSEAGVIFSNMPFTREAGTIGGSRINKMLGWTLVMPPAGVGVAVMGYAGHFRITLVADEAAMSRPEGEIFLEGVTDRLLEMSVEIPK